MISQVERAYDIDLVAGGTETVRIGVNDTTASLSVGGRAIECDADDLTKLLATLTDDLASLREPTRNPAVDAQSEPSQGQQMFRRLLNGDRPHGQEGGDARHAYEEAVDEAHEQIRREVYAAASDPANDLKTCRIATDAADRIVALLASTHGHEQEPRPLVTCPECEGECVVDGMEDADEDDDDETGDFFPAVVCPRCEGKGVDTLTDEEVADAANPALGAQSEPTQRQDRDSA